MARTYSYEYSYVLVLAQVALRSSIDPIGKRRTPRRDVENPPGATPRMVETRGERPVYRGEHNLEASRAPLPPYQVLVTYFVLVHDWFAAQRHARCKQGASRWYLVRSANPAAESTVICQTAKARGREPTCGWQRKAEGAWSGLSTETYLYTYFVCDERCGRRSFDFVLHTRRYLGPSARARSHRGRRGTAAANRRRRVRMGETHHHPRLPRFVTAANFDFFVSSALFRY